MDSENILGKNPERLFQNYDSKPKTSDRPQRLHDPLKTPSSNLRLSHTKSSLTVRSERENIVKLNKKGLF